MNFTGRTGKTLQETFTPYPFAYEGILVPEFPNFFITHGPNTNLTANAAVLGEQQVHYIIELLQTMTEDALSSVEVDAQSCRDYNDRVQEALKDTAWFRKGAAHGYYRHDDSGRIVLATPRHNSTVWHDTREPKMEHILSRRRNGEEKPERPAMPMLSI